MGRDFWGVPAAFLGVLVAVFGILARSCCSLAQQATAGYAVLWLLGTPCVAVCREMWYRRLWDFSSGPKRQRSSAEAGSSREFSSSMQQPWLNVLSQQVWRQLIRSLARGCCHGVALRHAVRRAVQPTRRWSSLAWPSHRAVPPQGNRELVAGGPNAACRRSFSASSSPHPARARTTRPSLERTSQKLTCGCIE